MEANDIVSKLKVLHLEIESLEKPLREKRSEFFSLKNKLDAMYLPNLLSSFASGIGAATPNSTGSII